ncbi:MAG: hypothetical protein KIT87_18265 [Anaerolineae bacterium]|nr:hypothetical protein [Anaerolineae bacterium]
MRLSARRQIIVMVMVLTCMGLFTASVGQASPAEQGQSQGAAIRLRAATFVPTQGQAPNIPPGLAIAGYPEGQKGYYIVQFVGPVEPAWKDEVTAEGGELLEYVPDFAFKVKMNPGQARKVEQLDSVAWVGLFHPAYKLDPATAQGATRLYKVRSNAARTWACSTASITSI